MANAYDYSKYYDTSSYYKDDDSLEQWNTLMSNNNFSEYADKVRNLQQYADRLANAGKGIANPNDSDNPMRFVDEKARKEFYDAQRAYNNAMEEMMRYRNSTGRSHGDMLWSYDAEKRALDKEYQSLLDQYGSYVNNRKQADEKKAAEQKAVTDARESTIAEREASAKNAYTQARNNGQGRGLAASIGNAPLSGATASNYANSYNNLSNLGQSTQNDYLQKMGYVNSLNQQADNLEKNAGWNILGAAVGGAGSGAQIGNSLFGGMGSKGDN